MTRVRIVSFRPTGTEHSWCLWAVEIVSDTGEVMHRWPVETHEQSVAGKRYWEETLAEAKRQMGGVEPDLKACGKCWE